MSADKYLIQSLMWRQCVSEDVFKQLVAKCLNVESRQVSQPMTESEVNNEMISQLVSKVNRNMRSFNLKISRGPNESDGTVYYALINTGADELTRMLSQWSHKEILYFRKLMASIIESDNSFISSTKALNIGREEDIKFSMTVAENLLNKWVEQKWFEEISNGSLAIGVRTLLELNVHLRDEFEIQDCFRCKVMCIRGSNCVSCDTKLHNHCVDSQFIPNNKCPNCSKQWTRNGDLLATNSEQTLDSSADNEEPVRRVQRAKRTKRS